MAALTPVLIGVMRMPLSPRAMASSIAVIWPWSSPSCLPEATVSLTLFFAASALAPSCMATKNGLVESLVMRATPTAASPPAPSEADSRLQAARDSAAAAAVNTAIPERREGRPVLRALEVVTG